MSSECVYAGSADEAVAKQSEVIERTAEYAGVLNLADHDAVARQRHIKLIADLNAEDLAVLLWNDQASEFIYPTHDPLNGRICGLVIGHLNHAPNLVSCVQLATRATVGVTNALV